MKLFGKDTLLAKDDKIPGKFRKVDATDVFLHMVDALVKDGTWILRRDISRKSVQAYAYTKARLGLPRFLLKGSPMAGLPWMFFQVKSKCWSVLGALLCSKPGHSHWRRIVDNSTTPWRRAWNTMGRAIKGVLVFGVRTHEVHSLQQAPQQLFDALGALLPPEPVCRRCGCHMNDTIGIAAADIDQAFEACDAATLMDD